MKRYEEGKGRHSFVSIFCSPLLLNSKMEREQKKGDQYNPVIYTVRRSPNQFTVIIYCYNKYQDFFMKLLGQSKVI